MVVWRRSKQVAQMGPSDSIIILVPGVVVLYPVKVCFELGVQWQLSFDILSEYIIQKFRCVRGFLDLFVEDLELGL